MNGLETMTKLNSVEDLKHELKENPLKLVTEYKDAFKAPDYSRVDIDLLEKASGKKVIETLFVDSSGFGGVRESALTVSQFSDAVVGIMEEHGEVYVCLTGVGQFQVYVSFLK